MFTTSCHCETVRRAAPLDDLDTLAINVRNAEQPDTVANLPMRLLDGASTWSVLRETVEPDWWRSQDNASRTGSP